MGNCGSSSAESKPTQQANKNASPRRVSYGENYGEKTHQHQAAPAAGAEETRAGPPPPEAEVSDSAKGRRPSGKAERMATNAERFIAIDELMNLYKEAVSRVLLSARQSGGASRVFHLLWNTDEFLAEIRKAARADPRSSVRLERVFQRYDVPPLDGVLDEKESLQFIEGYVDNYKGVVTVMYREGLEMLQEEGDESVKEIENKGLTISKAADKVAEQFSSVVASVIAGWHDECDKNKDGRLQFQEIYQSLLSEETGPIDKVLAESLGNEFRELTTG
eukprot:Hpha_TRINITY_DN5234_c0_g1::TRINITY_DN5234_c0_g1_i1::g.116699::m.116699